MIESMSLPQSDAIRRHVLRVAKGARIAPTVRFVIFEDDGGSMGPIVIGSQAIVRDGAVLCSGVKVGSNCIVGHNSVIRAGVSIDESTTVSHMVCIEKMCRIGSNVRISSLTHITGQCVVEDDAQIGARVVFVNDKKMNWRNDPSLQGSRVCKGARIGSGAVIMPGITVGAGSFVGAGAVVTRSVDPGDIVYGVPAYPVGRV